MQNSFQPKSVAAIAARNDPERIRLRLTLRFSLLYFTMFVLGLLLCRYTFVGALPSLHAQLDALFRSPFSECVLARDHVRAILLFSRHEMLLLLLISMAGLTFFTEAASDAALSAHALLFGVLCYTAVGAILAGDISSELSAFAFFVYFFAQLAQAAILLAAATEAVIFSYEYRDACRALRTQRDHVAVRYVLCAASHVGMILLARAAHALVLMLLEKL